MNLCKCGCGQESKSEKLWIQGHWAKGKNNPMFDIPSPLTGKKFSKEHSKEVGNGRNY